MGYRQCLGHPHKRGWNSSDSPITGAAPRWATGKGVDLVGRLTGSPQLCAGCGPSAAQSLGLSSLICKVGVIVPVNRDAAG